MSNTVIACMHRWKILGKHRDEVLKAVQEEGLGKTEFLERFHSVLAVADASLPGK